MQQTKTKLALNKYLNKFQTSQNETKYNSNKHVEEQSNEQSKNENDNHSSSNEQPKQKKVYIPKDETDPTKYVFEMKKTEIPDVYILSCVELVIKDSKKYLKRIKIGLAYIPNIQCSMLCNEFIKKMEENGNTENLLVNCKYHEDKHKWEPISISSSKRPSFINEFEQTYL